MSQEYRCPTILIRTTGGIGVEHVINDYLEALSKYTLTIQIIIDARNELTPGSPGDFVVFTKEFETDWLCHKIFKNRAEIFSSNIEKLKNSPKAQETYFVYGKISFSKDGSKITATAPQTDKKGKSLHISTDIEILKYVFNKYKDRPNTIYWYYSPEKN